MYTSRTDVPGLPFSTDATFALLGMPGTCSGLDETVPLKAWETTGIICWNKAERLAPFEPLNPFESMPWSPVEPSLTAAVPPLANPFSCFAGLWMICVSYVTIYI